MGRVRRKRTLTGTVFQRDPGAASATARLRFLPVGPVQDSRGRPCVSLRGAARLLGCRPSSVESLLRRGALTSELLSVVAGGMWRLIPIDQIEAYLRQRQAKLSQKTS